MTSQLKIVKISMYHSQISYYIHQSVMFLDEFVCCLFVCPEPSLFFNFNNFNKYKQCTDSNYAVLQSYLYKLDNCMKVWLKHMKSGL